MRACPTQRSCDLIRRHRRAPQHEDRAGPSLLGGPTFIDCRGSVPRLPSLYHRAQRVPHARLQPCLLPPVASHPDVWPQLLEAPPVHLFPRAPAPPRKERSRARLPALPIEARQPTSPRRSRTGCSSTADPSSAAAPSAADPSALQPPAIVETFILHKKMKSKRRMALLEARGLDQLGAEELCNCVELECVDGSRWPALALAPYTPENGCTSLQNLVGCSNWMAIAADEQGAAGRRHPRGIALVQWADALTGHPAGFGSTPFCDDSGAKVTPEAALECVRRAANAGKRARVHQLVLLGGRGAGAALMHGIVAASGVNADDLLYVSAAHVPVSTKHLWECVYARRFGFTRVANLRANLENTDDMDEAHEMPMVIRVGDLREAAPVLQQARRNGMRNRARAVEARAEAGG